jgi:hypothetical protein
MKWIGIILGGIAALIVLTLAGLAIASSRPDANRLQSSIVIRQPPAAIWPYLYEPDKVKRWVSWLVEVRRDKPGSPAAGDKAVWVMEDRNNGNMRMDINSTVSKADANRLLAVDLSSPGAFRGKASYMLTDLGNGATRVDLDSRYEFDNAFARLMMPLVAWQAGKKMKSDLEQLRAALEGAPTSVQQAAK